MARFNIFILLLAFIMIGCQNQQPDFVEGESSDNLPVEGEAVQDNPSFPDFQFIVSDSYSITPEVFLNLLKNGADAIILDIRRPDDYAAAHIAGSIHTEFSQNGVLDVLSRIPDTKPVYIISNTGQSAAQFTYLLHMAGKQAQFLRLGFSYGILPIEGFNPYLSSEPFFLDTGNIPVDTDVSDTLSIYFSQWLWAEQEGYGGYHVSPDFVNTCIQKEGRYTIVSLLQPDDHSKGAIPSAINIPAGQASQEQFEALPKEKPIIIYCYTGQESSLIVGALRCQGYDAYSLYGGIGTPYGTGWLGAGYDLISPE